MIIGQIICDKCGRDCTALYGYALAVRGQVRSQKTQQELAEVKKKYGKEDFYFCWGCTAEVFGIKPLVPAKEPEQPKTVTVDTAQTFVIESKNDKKSPMRA
jgi:hypothetical protein